MDKGDAGAENCQEANYPGYALALSRHEVKRGS
jgi:hypothetical protein